MPRLRLFAHLREAAGTAVVDVDGATVGAVLESATSTFGPDFEAGLAASRVWVNGDPADETTAVASGDEIAVLPPVSGGQQASVTDFQVPWAAVVVVALAGLLFLDPAFFVAGAVGALAAWALDLSQANTEDPVGLPAVLVSIIAGVLAPAVFLDGNHLEGVGLAVAIGVVATFAQAAFWPRARSLVSLGSTMIVSVVAAAAAASLSIVRLADGGTSALWVLLAVCLVSSLAAAGSERVPGHDRLDPLSAGAIGAELAGLVVSYFQGLAVVPYLLVSMVLALALIAGRAMGSLVRTGKVLLVDSSPGLLTPLDGPVLGAALLLYALVLFL